MMKFKQGVAMLVPLLAMSAWSLGWNDVGHMTVARIAYDQLTPETKQKVGEILKALPHYETLMQYKPAGYDEAAYAFIRAATWPDAIRSDKHPMHSEHHSPWHYINYPLDAPGGSVKGPMPEENWDGHSEPTNILQALAKSEKGLAEPSEPSDRRAIDLCWVEHLIGDLHQPLHSTAYFSKDFPEGDKGGNTFMVGGPLGNTGLHSYWDSLMGVTRSATAVDAIARRLEKDPLLTREALKAKLATPDIKDWAHESFDAAKSVAYQNAQLPGINKELLQDKKSTEAPPLPVGYGEKARKMADERVMLAGDRLADWLNAHFGK